MSYNPVIWMILIGCVLAIDVYKEIPGEFDYEVENAMDATHYWPNSNRLRDRDAEDLRSSMILFKLMKTMQDDPEAFYKTDYVVDSNPDPMLNRFETFELRPPFVKRSSNTEETGVNTKPSKGAAKPRPRKQPNSRRRPQRPRPQPKQKPKVIYPMCYLKLCEFKLPQL